MLQSLYVVSAISLVLVLIELLVKEQLLVERVSA
jgi:hypothetical protein